MTEDTSTITLDSDQTAAATIPPNENQIVLAGPGSGKSETVGALIRTLVTHHEIFPEDILVLSFSRAAAKVVKDRAQGVSQGFNHVEVRTIDSFAAEVVEKFGDDQRDNGVIITSYDDTVLLAIQILKNQLQGQLEYLHVIVDEVQDVTGLRADLLLALIQDALPPECGVTYLGDPAQALFDFEVGGTSNVELLERTVASRSCRMVDLKGAFRFRTKTAQVAARHRKTLLSKDGAARLALTRGLIAEIPPLGPLDEEAVSTIARWSGSTAFLCDTNIRASTVATQLNRMGFNATLGRRAGEQHLPSYLAMALEDVGPYTDPVALAEALSSRGCTCAEAIAYKLFLDGGRGRELDFTQLAKVFARPWSRLSYLDQENSAIVSTVHRAKGLEFENVVLVDPDDWDHPTAPDESLAATLFVALTRSNKRCTYLTDIPTRRWTKRPLPGSGEIWQRRNFKGNGLLGLILEDEFIKTNPLGSDAATLVGSPITWSPNDFLLTLSGEKLPGWQLSTESNVIAQTTERFGRLIKKNSWRGTPPRISGGYIESVRTVVDTRADLPRPFHVGASIAGDIALDWKDGESL